MNRFLLLGLLSLFCIALQGQNEVVIDGVTFSADRKTLISYPKDKADQEYVVPEGTEVIKSRAFCLVASLCSVTLPSTLKEIGNNTFFYCYSLISITWGNFPETVGRDIFYGSPIQEFHVLNEISNCTVIDNVLFSVDKKILLFYPTERKHQNQNITEYIIPEGTEVIKSQAFCRVSSLCSVTLSSTLKEIGHNAFSYCYSLISITWGNFPEVIGRDVFYQSPIEEFRTLNEVCNCTVIDNVLFSPDKKRLLRYPQMNRYIMNYYIVPEGTEVINEFAFERANLYNISLPSTLKTIENGAFWVEAHTPVRSNKQVEWDDEFNFDFDLEYRVMEDVVCNALIPPVLIGNPFGFPKKIALFVPTSSFEAYCNTIVWKDFRTINGENVSVSALSAKNTKNTNVILLGNSILDIKSDQYIIDVRVYNQMGVLLIGQNADGYSCCLNIDRLLQGILLVKVIYNDATEDIFKLCK